MVKLPARPCARSASIKQIRPRNRRRRPTFASPSRSQNLLQGQKTAICVLGRSSKRRNRDSRALGSRAAIEDAAKALIAKDSGRGQDFRTMHIAVFCPRSEKELLSPTRIHMAARCEPPALVCSRSARMAEQDDRSLQIQAADQLSRGRAGRPRGGVGGAGRPRGGSRVDLVGGVGSTPQGHAFSTPSARESARISRGGGTSKQRGGTSREQGTTRAGGPEGPPAPQVSRTRMFALRA